MKRAKQLCIVSKTPDMGQQCLGYLSDSEWTIQNFSDPSLAVEHIRQYSPGVVLVDLPLAEMEAKFSSMSGAESSSAYITVLENPTAMNVASCFRHDAVDILIKPFSKEAFLKSIERSSKYQKILNENRSYRLQLEETNRDLQDNLKILEMDQLAGRQIQQSMLPTTPQQHGEYEIAHYIVPSLYLSGDFVGYHVIFDRYLVFYAADVSGHGASSAFLTIVLRFLLTRILRRHIGNNDRKAMARAPEGFIEYINRQILEIGIDKHLTMFSGSIDMERNILRYSVGAHMPMPIFVDDSETRVMPGKGKPLGIFEDVEWAIEERTLPEKFALILTSDGVLEVLPGDDLMQKEQFLLKAVSKSDTSINSVCTELGITELQNAPDDVTVLTVRRGY